MTRVLTSLLRFSINVILLRNYTFEHYKEILNELFDPIFLDFFQLKWEAFLGQLVECKKEAGVSTIGWTEILEFRKFSI